MLKRRALLGDKEIIQVDYVGIRAQMDILVMKKWVMGGLDGVIRIMKIQPGVKNGIEVGMVKIILTDTLFEVRKPSMIS
jgi:hypothetical protein